MELTDKIKIDDLLNKYPFLLDFLITLSPMFKNLKNPIMRKTLGKIATLSKVSAHSGLDLKSLMSSIAAEIEKKTGEVVTIIESGSTISSAPVNDSQKRQEILKGIITDLHAGEDIEILKERFKQLVHGVEASEVAKMEQELMDEGLPPEEIKRLCSAHVEIFKDALQEKDLPEPPPGH